VRPTADQVREAVFQILAPHLADARVLDLFAGTGALGIEALSRGAATCVFVERRPEVAAVLRRNLRELDLTARSRVLVGAVERRLPAIGRTQPGGFDLVLLDPPYDHADIDAVLTRLPLVLAADGRIVWEHAHTAAAPPPMLAVVDRRTYGQTAVSLLVPVPSGEPPA
jgi:16S rRNA (guanine966-N2)-methyltransferase